MTNEKMQSVGLVDLTNDEIDAVGGGWETHAIQAGIWGAAGAYTGYRSSGWRGAVEYGIVGAVAGGGGSAAGGK